MYQHVNDFGITDVCIIYFVVPYMREHFEWQILIFFAKTLLWHIFFEKDSGGMVNIFIKTG